MANRPNLHNSCPWEDVSYGWIPNPIRETGKYYNHLLPEFYRTYWPICYGSVATFKSAFMLERKRQWEEKELLAKAEKQLSFVCSENTAAGGRFLDESYIPKKNDLHAIRKVSENAKKLKSTLDSQLQKIKRHKDSLFVERRDGRPGMKMKAGRDQHFKFDEEMIQKIDSNISKVVKVMQQLSCAEELFAETFKTERSNPGMSNKKRLYDSRWKAEKRRSTTLRNKATQLFEQLGGSLAAGEYFQPENGAAQITNIDIRLFNESMIQDARNVEAVVFLNDANVFREDAGAIVNKFLYIDCADEQGREVAAVTGKQPNDTSLPPKDIDFEYYKNN
eukprot:Seg8459.1 transcript_id=Seg8459.1/GoldUCD/mRNA.D3Y31 product="hypothetical protein" protein_id=Seg8459.1/GoldUCD/D3Y31